MTYSSKVIVTSEHEYLYSTYLMYMIVTCSFYHVPDCTPDLLSQISTTSTSRPTEAIKLFFIVADSEGYSCCHFLKSELMQTAHLLH